MTNNGFLKSLLTRRDTFRLGAVGAAAMAGLGSVDRAIGACTASPTETEGPYWVDEMLNRSDIRSDPGSGVVQQGLPFRMLFNLSEITGGTVCTPMAGAYVDIWHCNAFGIYSDVSAQNTVGQKFLRGYQVTDTHGNARFLSVYPGYYNGRTVHIHFRVRKFSGATVTFNFVSQTFFNDPTTTSIFQQVAPYNTRPARTTFNSNDMVYATGGAQLLMRMSFNGNHAIASFNIVVNSIAGLLGGDGVGSSLLTPTHDDSLEHLNDFGGGTPPLESLFSK
jgi:protocatechuate 3,4-dioxygenase beta subunit